MKTILVTGGNGLVGNAIKQIKSEYEAYYIFMESSWCNLLNYEQTLTVFNYLKPDVVIHLAAHVGGLFKNMNEKVQMLEDNLLINTNVVKAAHQTNVNTLIACLSTCVFPDDLIPPINENMLHDGPPHESNEGYAYAKRMMEVHCRLYREQFKRNYFCIIPTNIYGPHDNFSLENGHVIPSLIHKCYLAKESNLPFEVKGSGKPSRHFIYNMDLARILLLLIDKNNIDLLILSPSEEYTISEMAQMINSHFGNEMVFNTNFSDGQYRKTTDNSKLKRLINFEFTSLKDGIEETVKWFMSNYPNVRN
uniref:NAD-dependent epimerase/dehydratase domain-containing protein n=1 Tax=viral metagenome TaxID=1070528 RepID=A0A6C0AZ32_9ZZZZ